MNDINKKTMALAARSVFAEMYNNKKDITSVVSEYIIEILNEIALSFSIEEMQNKLLDKYGISIPSSIVKSALKKIVKEDICGVSIKKQGVYYSIEKRPCEHKADVDEKNTHLKTSVLLPLFNYIEKKENKTLSGNEKNIIESELCTYLLDKENAGEYSNLISCYLVSREKDANFTKDISFIREGTILELGLRYTGVPSISQYCNNELYIFLDTEILFSAKGLNGTVFKNLFDSFFEQVEAINQAVYRKYRKKYVSLFYTKNVENEINNYFDAAQRSIRLNKFEPFPKDAMKNILMDCKEASDVVAKRVDFFRYIEEKRILLYKRNFQMSDEVYRKYNISCGENVSKIAQDMGISNDEAYRHLEVISFINCLRDGGEDKNVDTSRYIYVTGKNARLSVAKMFKDEKGCVAATSLDWLTNIFWYRLNRGVLNEKRPLSFDAITKAKILLASDRNEKIAKLYDKYSQEKQNETEEQNSAYIYELKKGTLNADDINSENINDIQDTLFSNESFQVYEERKKKESEERKEMERKIEEANVYKEKYEKLIKFFSRIFRCLLGFIGLFALYYSYRTSVKYELWNSNVIRFFSMISIIFSICPFSKICQKIKSFYKGK